MMIEHGTVIGVVAMATDGSADPTLWYVTRAAALAAYITMTIGILLGLVRTAIRRSGDRIPWLLDEFHQFVELLAGVLILTHLVTLLLDPFLPFSLVNLLVPLNEPYRPTAILVGIVANYTIIVVLLTSWIKRFIPYAFWRTLHYLSFVAFAAVTLHGWLAGSDSGEPWAPVLYICGGTAVVLMLALRLVVQQAAPPARQAPRRA